MGAPTPADRSASSTRTLEIFRAGKHTAVDGTVHEITREQLLECAQAYDPAVCEAPFVVGHPQLNAPAYGWGKNLVERDGKLVVEAHQVDPQFAEMVNAGRFKKVSASFFLPDSPHNPKPGKLYLRHVGFLGATPPSVKGLRDASFAEKPEGVIDFALGDKLWAFRQIGDLLGRVRDWFVEKEGVEAADQLLPRWQIDSINEAARHDDSASAVSYAEPPARAPETTVTDKTAEFAERETALKTKEEQIAARERALADAEKQRQRGELADFAEGLVKEGKLLPREKGATVELLTVLAPAGEISFAEGDGATVKKTPLEAFKALLTSLPKRIDFREKSGAPMPNEGAIAFAAPDEGTVDRAQLELHAKAIAYQRQHPNVPYLDAVAAVSG